MTGTSTITPPPVLPVNPGTTGRVNWWSLDEASGLRTDAYINGLDLMDNGGVGSVPGKVATAASFVPGQYLSSGDNPELQLGSSDFTLCLWSYMNNATNEQSLISKASLTANSVGATNKGAWNFVCVLRAGSTLSISVNGEVEVAGTILGSIYTRNSDFRLGSDTMDGLNGWMDEVVLYNRSLTEAERNWLYNNGSGRSYSELMGFTPTPTSTSTLTITDTPIH